jgi:hypothetical protein
LWWITKEYAVDNLYKKALSLSRNCIYVFVHHGSKRFMIGHTNNLLNALARIGNDLETPKYLPLKNDMEEVDIQILEENIDDVHTRKILVSKHRMNYIGKGYKEYFPSNFVKYTLHTEIVEINNKALFMAYLRDTRKNKVLVGLFDNKDEMSIFLDTYYKDNMVRGIYYANNEDTRMRLMKGMEL